MPLSRLPPPVAAFLAAAKARDGMALGGLFASDAVLTDRGQVFVGEAISQWGARRPACAVDLHPINLARRGGRTVLTVMMAAQAAATAMARPIQQDLCFSLQGDRIASLDVTASAQPIVPAVVADFIQAMNTFDLERLLATFAPDAMLNDQLQEVWGLAAIREWAAAEIVGRRVTMYVTDVVEHHGHVIVRANVDGEYDKRGLPDPLRLSFYVFAPEGRIAQLLILHNATDAPGR